MQERHDRRDFLKQTLLAGVLLGTAHHPLHQACQAAPRGARMRIGLVTYLWGQDWDLPTLLANCEKTSILGVELRTQHAHGVEVELSPDQRREVKKRFADSPVTLVGMGCNWDFHHTDADRLRSNIEGAQAYAKLSHDCGGSGVKVKPNTLPQDVPVAQTCEQIGKSLDEVGRYAAQYQQAVRVEVHGRKTSELPIIKQIFDHVTEANVGICWNSNDEDLKGQGLRHNFNLVKDRFGETVHVRELNLGDYPYQQLMDLFVKEDYDGWILLEARSKPADRIAALHEQKQVFDQMVANAQAKL